MGEPGDHGLHEAVTRLRDPGAVHHGDERDQAEEQERRQHPHLEEVARVHREGGSHADQHEPDVEEQVEAVEDRQVERENEQTGQDGQPRDAAA
jgi:hypothetical protein